MKAYRIEILVLDFDGHGAEGIREIIENVRYPNDCIIPDVKAIEAREIGPWDDGHPLNNRATSDAEYKRLFAGEAS